MAMRRANTHRCDYSIPLPRYEESKKSLVGRGGLQVLLHILDSMELSDELEQCLPIVMAAITALAVDS